MVSSKNLRFRFKQHSDVYINECNKLYRLNRPGWPSPVHASDITLLHSTPLPVTRTYKTKFLLLLLSFLFLFFFRFWFNVTSLKGLCHVNNLYCATFSGTVLWLTGYMRIWLALPLVTLALLRCSFTSRLFCCCAAKHRISND